MSQLPPRSPLAPGPCYPVRSMTQRRPTKPVHIGDVQIGGDAPVVVQSMCSTDTADVQATLRQVRELAGLGCEIVRIAVPDKEAAAALPDIVSQTPVPLI